MIVDVRAALPHNEALPAMPGWFMMLQAFQGRHGRAYLFSNV